MKDKLKLRGQLLKSIFDFAPKNYVADDYSTHHPLAKKFNINNKELDDNLDFLFKLRLIAKFPNKENHKIWNWEVTQQGFQYLEEKERIKNERNYQVLIVTLTFILALSATVQSLTLIYPGAKEELGITLIFLYIFMILVSAGFAFYQSFRNILGALK